MAATAGGVAIGSTVGHVVGNMITGGGSSSSSAPAPSASPAPAAAATAPAVAGENGGPCAAEIKDFIKCATDQADLSLCQGFNDVLKECKAKHSLSL